MAVDPRTSKRSSCHDWEETKEKRQSLGKAYDDIIADAFTIFGPAIFACDIGNIKPTILFTFSYEGKDRDRAPATVALRFLLQKIEGQPGQMPAFSLTFMVTDSKGTINNFDTMRAQCVPYIAKITCDQRACEIKEWLRYAMHGWLDFAYDTY